MLGEGSQCGSMFPESVLGQNYPSGWSFPGRDGGRPLRMEYQVVEAQSFWDCVDTMRNDTARYKAALMDTLVELRRKPFQNPKLTTHGVGEASNGKKIYASDVGGRASDRRVVWQLFNRTILLLLYGNHKVYDRIKRMRVDFDPGVRAITIFEKAPDSNVDRTYQHQRERSGKLFAAWTDGELLAYGFPPDMVEHLRGLNSDAEFLELEGQIGARYFNPAFNLIAYGHPAGEAAASLIIELEEDPKPPEVTEEDREAERHLQHDTMASWFTRTEPEYLAEVMGRPIEDWMIFLHPDQRNAVRRNYKGPARVRGPAGTGKTVVGLHRAVWLARRNLAQREERSGQLAGTTDRVLPVLFTTFINSLPPVLESLYLRMPGALSGEVEFANVNKLATRLCYESGKSPRFDSRAVREAFDAAYARIVTPRSPLDRRGLSKRYLVEEVNAVIKGRALESLDEYRAIERTGRRAPLGRNQRKQVWELREAWDQDMAARRVMDFPDQILAALDYARRLPEPRYSAIVVDEAQDLTLAGLQLLRALVNAPNHDHDRSDGLLVLGDGAQRIYPGGYTLRQAGVEVRGRTTVLDVNYRNTSHIIGAALAVAGEIDVVDLGEDYRRSDQLAGTIREGPRPLLIRARDSDDQVREIARWIREMEALEDPIMAGDTAVLVPWNRQAKTAERLLKGRGLGVQMLDRYDGRSNALVKVGTYHRGKGLEFKAVFLPYLNLGLFPPRPKRGISPEEADEAHSLEMSALFVAMTRARDLLVLLYNGAPSEAIQPVVDRFEMRSSTT